MENSHEIREFVWLYDRVDIMQSWTEESENKLIEFSSRMSVINNEQACLALTGCVPLNARRRSASCVVEGVQSDATRRRVELSCVAINGA